MLLVLPVSHVDYNQASALLWWMRDLGGDFSSHNFLLVASQTLEPHHIQTLVNSAKMVGFQNVSGIHLKKEDPRGWPFGPNLMFATAAEHIRQLRPPQPFFWMEPDATPLKSDWLNAIEREYKRAGKPFMGVVFSKPWTHMNGVAVYPPDVGHYNQFMLQADHLPFDTVRPELVLPNAHTTDLLQHVWGDVETNTPPSFTSAQDLAIVSRDAVVFHRCKDGSLIKRLAEKRGSMSMPSNTGFSTKGKKQSRVAVLGLIKFHNPAFGKMMRSLDAMLSSVGTWSATFCVDNLNSPNIKALKEWSIISGKGADVFQEPSQLPGRRYQRMALLRNMLLKRLKESGNDPEFVLMLDTDIAGFAEWGGLRTLLKDRSWDAAAVLGLRPRFELPHFHPSTEYNLNNNTYAYYDLLALESVSGHRTIWPEGTPPRAWYWHGSTPPATIFTSLFPIDLRQGPMVEVNSAFGPAAFYRWEVIRELSYDESTEQCEHHGFHGCVRDIGGRVFVTSKVVALYSDPWNQVKQERTVIQKAVNAIQNAVGV